MVPKNDFFFCVDPPISWTDPICTEPGPGSRTVPGSCGSSWKPMYVVYAVPKIWRSTYNILQGGAPKIAKLVYNYNN